MGALYGTRTVYSQGTHEFTPGFSGVYVSRSLVFCVVFCRSLFVLFLLPIVLSVLLQFSASDYPFGIFKSFLATVSSYQHNKNKRTDYLCENI